MFDGPIWMTKPDHVPVFYQPVDERDKVSIPTMVLDGLGARRSVMALQPTTLGTINSHNTAHHSTLQTKAITTDKIKATLAVSKTMVSRCSPLNRHIGVETMSMNHQLGPLQGRNKLGDKAGIYVGSFRIMYWVSGVSINEMKLSSLLGFAFSLSIRHDCSRSAMRVW